ncbi:MAG: MFS transporter [Alphaproteobacteria bacterium]|nr:MFS transporter [Alphaproteobacteria bacterium]
MESTLTNGPTTSEPDHAGLKFGPVWMMPGISPLNVYTLLYIAFFTIASSVFLSATQPYLFNTVLNIPIDIQGSLSGRLVLFNELVVIVLIGPLGLLADKIGRRPIYAAGYVFLFIGYMLYPTAESVPELTLYRMVFAIGVACNTAMIATVQADYPQNAWRGKLLGLCGLLQGIGVVIVLGVSRSLPGWFVDSGMDQIAAGRFAFWTFAVICLINAVIVRLGLKGGVPSVKAEKEPLRTILSRGVKAGRNPRIALSYVAAFVSRGDLTVVSTFFSLWLVQAGIANGYTAEEALEKGLLFFIIVQAIAVLWAPFAGLIIDRFDRVTALSIAMGIAAVGYLSLGFIGDPTQPIMYGAAVILGMGEINAVLAAQALIGQEAPKDYRGAVVGVFGFFGAIGILLAASIGGYLFDAWMPAGPFVLMGAANATLLVIAVCVRILAKPPIPNATTEEKN